MVFYPLEFCSVITPTELQKATCTNYEEFYFLIFHLLSLFLWDWLFTHLMTLFLLLLLSEINLTLFFLCTFLNISHFLKLKFLCRKKHTL